MDDGKKAAPAYAASAFIPVDNVNESIEDMFRKGAQKLSDDSKSDALDVKTMSCFPGDIPINTLRPDSGWCVRVDTVRPSLERESDLISKHNAGERLKNVLKDGVENNSDVFTLSYNGVDVASMHYGDIGILDGYTARQHNAGVEKSRSAGRNM